MVALSPQHPYRHTNMIVLPKPSKPTYALSYLRSRRKWVISYKKNGRKVVKQLKAGVPLEQAIAQRDAFFKKLLDQGAQYAGSTQRHIDEDRFIYRGKRKYRVVVRGKWVGSFTDIEEAREARDNYVKTLES